MIAKDFGEAEWIGVLVVVWVQSIARVAICGACDAIKEWYCDSWEKAYGSGSQT